MKKLASILVLVIAVTFTAQAQQKRGNKGPKLTAEQQATLVVKKMTLALDLSDKQQSQIKPILMTKIAERKAAMEKRKEAKDKTQRPTADEMYALQIKRLDDQIMMKNKMKSILNKEQFEQFEKMQKGRKMMAMNGKKGDKKNRKDRDNRTQRGK